MGGEDDFLEAAYEERYEEDDLHQYNLNEADDYRHDFDVEDEPEEDEDEDVDPHGFLPLDTGGIRDELRYAEGFGGGQTE